MITHIVFFKLSDKSSEAVAVLVELLNKMDGKVESLQHLEVGVDYRATDRSYDVALITKFLNRTDLDAYASHPAHLPVLSHMKEKRIQTVIVDYES